nr:MAG TPA: tail protein [Caudoviricetes sp.]
MSISTELTRLQTARNKLRTKLIALGLVTATAKLDDCATAVDGITNQGAVSATVQEGDTFTIPAGYHNGSGTVSGVAGGGNYKLQSKTVAPTKAQQAVTPDSGYYGLSDVTVSAIPDAYQDVSSVTATAADTLTGKVFVTSDGTVTTGTMANNGAVTKALDAATTSYTIPKGYHSGAGKVTVTVETKEVTPTKAAQEIVPSTGKLLSKVSVAAIPNNYVDTGDADAAAANILDSKTAYVNGAKVVGTMPNNGSVSASMDGLTTTSVTISAGYTSGGTVSLTSDIEDALAAI